MTKGEIIELLDKLRERAEALPRLKGRASVITKIKKLTKHLKLFKYEDGHKTPQLILKECEQAYNVFNEFVQSVEQAKAEEEKCQE